MVQKQFCDKKERFFRIITFFFSNFFPPFLPYNKEEYTQYNSAIAYIYINILAEKGDSNLPCKFHLSYYYCKVFCSSRLLCQKFTSRNWNWSQAYIHGFLPRLINWFTFKFWSKFAPLQRILCGRLVSPQICKC